MGSVKSFKSAFLLGTFWECSIEEVGKGPAGTRELSG